jgi:hypothetical protein
MSEPDDQRVLPKMQEKWNYHQASDRIREFGNSDCTQFLQIAQA